jgi:hypothetical protein
VFYFFVFIFVASLCFPVAFLSISLSRPYIGKSNRRSQTSIQRSYRKTHDCRDGRWRYQLVKIDEKDHNSSVKIKIQTKKNRQRVNITTVYYLSVTWVIFIELYFMLIYRTLEDYIYLICIMINCDGKCH